MKLPQFDQAFRNKLYAVATAVFGVLVVIGVWDQVTSDEATTILNSVLDLLDRIAALAVSFGAFVKSRPGSVAVVEGVAAKDVQAVITPDGTALAGPAADLKNGTPVGQVAVVDSED